MHDVHLSMLLLNLLQHEGESSGCSIMVLMHQL